jgi:LPXTG-motif cell wall-anchored protein
LAGSTVVSPPTGAQAAAPTAAQALPNTGAPADLPWLAGAALASIMAGIVVLTTRRKQVGS